MQGSFSSPFWVRVRVACRSPPALPLCAVFVQRHSVPSLCVWQVRCELSLRTQPILPDKLLQDIHHESAPAFCLLKTELKMKKQTFKNRNRIPPCFAKVFYFSWPGQSRSPCPPDARHVCLHWPCPLLPAWRSLRGWRPLWFGP